MSFFVLCAESITCSHGLHLLALLPMDCLEFVKSVRVDDCHVRGLWMEGKRFRPRVKTCSCSGVLQSKVWTAQICTRRLDL